MPAVAPQLSRVQVQGPATVLRIRSPPAGGGLLSRRQLFPAVERFVRPRLVIAEDHELVAEGLRSLLEPTFEVLALVRDGDQVISAVEQYRPDVILLDLALPGRSGMELIAPLRKRFPELKVVVVTMYGPNVVSEMALQRGASACVPKWAESSELVAAITDALAGRIHVPIHSGVGPEETYPFSSAFHRLTEKEQNVVLLVARGLNNDQIASWMGTTARTVHFHRTNIRHKLRLHSDFDLHRFAILAALGEEEGS